MQNRFRKIVSPAVGLLAVAAFTSLYAAGPATPAEQQKARHDHYKQLGEANKAVRDLSRSDDPDFAALEKAATEIQESSVNQSQWFAKGTGPEAGKTRALPEIWTKNADFAAAEKMFSDSAPKLLAAVKAKDIDAVRTSFREVGTSCKNCHDKFRASED